MTFHEIKKTMHESIMAELPYKAHFHMKDRVNHTFICEPYGG